MNKNDEFENNDIENDIEFEETEPKKSSIDNIDVSDIFGKEEIPFAIDESLISEDGYLEISENADSEDEEIVDEEEIEPEEETEPVNDSEEEIYVEPEEKKGPKRARKKVKKKMQKKRIVVIILSIILLLLIGIVGFGQKTCQSCWEAIKNAQISKDNQIYQELEKIDTSNIEKYEKINILLLGVDKEGLRCDSIMVMSYNTKTHKINLMSIPRDTRVRDDKMGRYRKINALRNTDISKEYGPAAVAKAVKNLTGMPINYYVEFSFDALDKTMDILGPVTFDVPDLEGKGRGMNYDDGYQGLHIHLKPGVQELSGNQIQQFLRYRKSNYRDAKYVDGSDQKRVERQQALLAAIIDQKLNLQSIAKIDDIFGEVGKGLKTTFSTDDVKAYAAYLAKNVQNISSKNMESVVMPGMAKTIGGASYYVADPEEIAEVVKEMFGYDVKAEELSNRINRKSGTTAMADDEPAKKEEKDDKDSQYADHDEEEEEEPEDEEEELPKDDSEEEPEEDTPADEEDEPKGDSEEKSEDKSDSESKDEPSGEPKSDSKKNDSTDEDEVVSLD